MDPKPRQRAPLLLPVWLPPDDETAPFPPADSALEHPNGLLAIGGSLSPERLERAYCGGIFPWFSEGQEILWWSPDPRGVLFPTEFRMARSLRKRIRNAGFEVVFDRAFEDVMRACAEPRAGQPGTWITADMIRAYTALHERGLAHSVEVYRDGRLVGGLYGVAIGGLFAGESMFHHARDASKVALVHLVALLVADARPERLLDVQWSTPHLASLGVVEVPRASYLERLGAALDLPLPPAFM